MALIKSISGIRGTIGGHEGEALTPVDIVSFTYAFCENLKRRRGEFHAGKKFLGIKITPDKKLKVVVGRDARLSGEMVNRLVTGTLTACGVDVIEIGLASTPTTEMAVTGLKADGGIIITASHNPRQWNALKLLDENGEFLSAEEGRSILECVSRGNFNFCEVDRIGKVTQDSYVKKHVEKVLDLDAVDRKAVREAGFKVVVDAVNSVGGEIMPLLLKKMGVKVIKLNCKPTGDFAHNPEPLPENLTELSRKVVEEEADLGISVDPDVDRLALICEDGTPFGEEYTLVSVADYILKLAAAEGCKPYNLATVSNLSSSRALRDVTEAAGGRYTATAVGEVNVVAGMKESGAVIGGEGNGGIIYPALHYGRDAMVGVALFLSHLAHKAVKASELKASYPRYFIAKNKITLDNPAMVEPILDGLKKAFEHEDINTVDGVKISFESSRKWVHLRRSNTEPIIRIYSEARSEEEAARLAGRVMEMAGDLIGHD